MEIYYKRKKTWLTLCLGLIWLIVALTQWRSGSYFFVYLFLFSSLLYFGYALYQFFVPYIVISQSTIIKKFLPSKNILLSEIEFIHKNAQGFVIISKNQKLKIDQDAIDEKSKKALKSKFQELKLL